MSSKSLIPIKYLLIGDSLSKEVKVEYSVVKNSQIQTEASQIMDALCKTQKSKLNERNKIQGRNGTFYFIILPSNTFYLSLVDVNYQEDMVFKLFEMINNEYDKIILKDDSTNSQERKNSNGSISQIIEKHCEENPLSISKYHGEHDADLKIDMNHNLKASKASQSMNESCPLEEIRQSLIPEQNRQEVENITHRRNCKMTIIIVVIVIVVVLVIITPFFFRN